MTRLGQCVLTCPGTACFAGLEGEEKIKLGAAIRYFGDGWQISKLLGATRYWRIPVMDGEFVCEETTGLTKNAVGGGNLLIMGRDRLSTLAAAEAAVAAISAVPDVIMPFPGGIVRSGSKVGSKYKALPASTNDAYCPTLKGRVAERAHAGRRIGAGDRHRRADRRRGARRHGGGPAGALRTRRGVGACCASAPAITAASSENSTTISASCSDERAGAHAEGAAAAALRPVAR